MKPDEIIDKHWEFLRYKGLASEYVLFKNKTEQKGNQEA